MSNQAIPIDADELKRLRESHAELLESLRNLTGLARMRGGHLHEYKAAVSDANAIISRADAIEDAARMSAGFGEALELTREAVK
jgi:hypothetical protein